MKKNEIVLFNTEDNEVKLEVPVNGETVWLSRQQMAELFDRDVKTIGKHINNALHFLNIRFISPAAAYTYLPSNRQ